MRNEFQDYIERMKEIRKLSDRQFAQIKAHPDDEAFIGNIESE